MIKPEKQPAIFSAGTEMALALYDNAHNYLMGDRPSFRAEFGLDIPQHLCASLTFADLLRDSHFGDREPLDSEDTSWEVHQYRTTRAIVAQYGARRIIEVTMAEREPELGEDVFKAMHLQYIGDEVAVQESTS